MKVILVSGWCCSGKDVVANYLVKKYGYIRYAFADALKDQVAERYNVPRHYFDDRILKEKKLINHPKYSPRDLCILEGNFARSIDPDVWINNIVRKVEKSTKLIVLSDLRFTNEMNAFKKLDSISIRINRFDKSSIDDITEHDLDNYKFDYVINNYGTLEEFYKKIDVLIKSL